MRTTGPLLVMVAVSVVLGSCGEDAAVVADFDGDCGGLGGPGAVVGVDVDSGALEWDMTVGDATAVAVTDGVVAGAGQSGAALGVEVATGETLWCVDFGRVDQEGNIVLPGFAASNGVLATAVAGGDVVGVDPRSGMEMWRTSIGVVEGLRVESGGDRFVIHGFDAADSHLVDLDAATGAEVTAAGSDADASGLTLRLHQPYLEDRQELDVAVERDGRELWSARLPGFAVTLHDDLVVIIDQTGGRGVFEGRADTRVSAYDASTGELHWQVPLPGTPQFAVGAGSVLVIPVGTVLYALDVRSGERTWESDVGSPGRGGRYSEAGTFRFLAMDDAAPGILVGAVVAEEPYRD